MSSRLIVKNLPKNISAVKLKEIFAAKGCVTDLQMKYTKSGVFRQFAFVGYKTEQEAEAAHIFFNNTYVKASKIKVEISSTLADENKPKAWSKHSQEKQIASKDKIDVKQTEEKTASSKDKKKKNKDKSSEAETTLSNIPEELQNDALFQEFLELNKDRKAKPLWGDDIIKDKDYDSDEDQVEEEEDNKVLDSKKEITEEPEKKAPITNVAKNMSDMEYLRSKMNNSSMSEDSNRKKRKAKGKKVKVINDQFTVKMKNLPFRCKKKQIKEFFKPLKYLSLRLPPKASGFAYVSFTTEKEMNRALNKNKSFLDGHRVFVVRYGKTIVETEVKEENNMDESKETNEDMIADTGRLFVRNLCYDVTEEELQEVFSKYGTINEIHIPIDSYTKKGQGFAFVTYMFAEHAVKAFSELDGTHFQGRLLHIIPGKPKKESNTTALEDLPFKQRKEAKLKALSGSSHNWNTLFLGMNAVADSMSARFKIKKPELLSNEEDESIAVRMALGETQLVMETRDFLLKNGVQLDAFSQAASERSKTIIIAKNLPSRTSSKDIQDVFSKHGIVSRVVIPPSGITALIEFQQTAEAKTAFKKLAYSKFGPLPLYLEWAPVNVFKEGYQVKEDSNKVEVEEAKIERRDSKPEKEDTTEPEPGAILFVKNINFNTTDEDFKAHFRKCGKLDYVSISKKKEINTGKLLSMGFGFVQYKSKSSAVQAIQELQRSDLDGYNLEIKFSNRATIANADTQRKKHEVKEQKDATKILVRNIPFEVSEKEVRDLFKEFGRLRSVRLPKKFSGEGSHRGFAFVDFHTKDNAKRAFDALCHSTHLLGRRLVLEWANTNSEDVSELRKKTARDFYLSGPSALKKSKLVEDVTMSSKRRFAEDED